jgi:hypothetical protein
MIGPPLWPWSTWEDWAAGLYEQRPALLAMIADSERLLGNSDAFRETAREMMRNWPNSTYHALRFLPTSARSWIGQASCCYAHGATGDETRRAWGRLSSAVQRDANAVADTLRDEWERGFAEALSLD